MESPGVAPPAPGLEGEEGRGRGRLLVPKWVGDLGPVHGWSIGRPSDGRLGTAC